MLGTMDIFISWSGPRSGALAEALKKWLPKIVNEFKPWLSSADIDKGTRWGSEVAGKLATSKAGIICLTPNNLTAPWILFEAGALSKTLENTFVCPLLVGLEPSDVTGPLAQFQATKATEDHILPLLKTLNRALGEGAMPDTHIEEVFDVWWPKLAAQVKALPEDGRAERPKRTEREMLEELVDWARGSNAHLELALKTATQRESELTARVAMLKEQIQSELSNQRSFYLKDLQGLKAEAEKERQTLLHTLTPPPAPPTGLDPLQNALAARVAAAKPPTAPKPK
jgi:hypothetical protein